MTINNYLPSNLPCPTTPSHQGTTFSSIAEKLMKKKKQQHQQSSSLAEVYHHTVAEARDEIFHLCAEVGPIMSNTSCFVSQRSHHHPSYDHDDATTTIVPVMDDDGVNFKEEDMKKLSATRATTADNTILMMTHTTQLLGKVFLQLFSVADVCGLDLCTCILKKIQLNGLKYPVELCKGKSGKYTNYSQQTGITATEGQCTMNLPISDSTTTTTTEESISSSSIYSTTSSSTNFRSPHTTSTIEGMTMLIRNFANEREWHRYHTPRNIALALMGEVGELAEIFQWCGDEGLLRDILSEEQLDKVGQEIADVAIYLLRLCDVCHVPLGSVMMELL